MATKSRNTILVQLRRLLAGLEANPITTSLMIAGQTYTNAQLIAQVGTSIAAEEQALSAEATHRDSLRNRAQVRAANHTFLTGLSGMLQVRYTGASASLGEYGLAPKKPIPKRSTEEKLVMQAKNISTRQHRGTLGKRQKAGIRGHVTGVVIAPVTKPKKDED